MDTHRHPFLHLAAFVAVVCVMLAAATFALMPKNNREGDGMRFPYLYGFYSEPKNTIDIMVIGNSNAAAGFSPMELWNCYGYTSYVCGGSWQNMTQSLALLDDALEYQKPRLVILETDELFNNKKDDATSLLEEAVPLLKYHDGWKKFNIHNMLKEPTYTGHYPYKGQVTSLAIKPYLAWQPPKITKEIQNIPFVTRMLLDYFVDICKDNGISVMFICMPASIWTYSRHNGLKQYAEENGIPFLDLNIHLNECGFDWSKHSRDGGYHLNSQGAARLTALAGKFLSLHFKLTDHRADGAYRQWNQDYETYHEFMRGDSPSPSKTASAPSI